MTRAEPWGAAALVVLFIFAGVAPWWLVPLAFVAVVIGWFGTGLRWGLAACGVAVMAGAVLALSGTVLVSDVLIAVARGLCAGVLPWLVAVAWRGRRDLESSAAAAVVREHEAREQRLESQLAHERLRLAEQLHDDVGHALSLVALNLGRLELDRALTGATRSSIGLARSQVGEAVERLGVSVRSLRGASEPGGRVGRVVADPPDVAGLVCDARLAGADVTMTGQKRLGGVAQQAAVLAASVVREGLTNALRHAPSQPVTVRVEDDGPWVVVTVSNPTSAARGEQAPRTGGTGLRSLQSRVMAAGGMLDVEAREGRFTLRARFPRMLGETGRQVQSPAPDSARGLVAGLSRARRRGTILVGAAIAIPAVTLGAVTVGLAVANSREADRALLTAEQFGQIRVGDARTDIGHLLPRYTLPRPDGGRPGCDYFAITTNPFADEFEDAYEICWDQDLVVSTALVEGAAR